MAIPEPQFDELYRELILEHYRSPRNRGELADATYHLHGLNPVCGDEIRLDLLLDGDRIADVAFRGQGCSISQSSASMMTAAIKGRSLDDAGELLRRFRAFVQGDGDGDGLGDLEALEGVAKFPVRVKCALLSWNVLEDGIRQAAA